MRGSVIKKGDRWYVKIELDPDPRDGKRRQKWHSGYRNKREAERARVDLLSKFDRGEYVETTHETFGEFMTEWLVAIEPTVKATTFDSYSRNVRNHVIPYVGSVRLSKVDAGVLNGLYATLLASGRRPSSRKGAGYSHEVVELAVELRAKGLSHKQTADRLRTELSEAEHISRDTLTSLLRRVDGKEGSRMRPGLDRRSVSYVHAIVHRALKDAVRWGRLPRNPADASDPPKSKQKSDGVHSWDAETVSTFLEMSRAEDDRLHPLWVLIATTGMRRGEALGLRWSDLDLEAGRARVLQTLVQIGSLVSIGEPKTSSGRRPMSLDRGTIAVLKTHRHRMRQERLLVGADFNDLGLVFHQPDGSWLRPDAVSNAFLRRVARYGLPRLTVHGLRHTWATLALEQGIHPKVVQERLGHSTIAITLGIYSHVSPTLHDEAAEQIARLVLGASASRG